MTEFDPTVAWPTGSLGLLVEAAYHADRTIASKSWELWKADNPDPATIAWQTARVLTQAATTLSKLGTEPTDVMAWTGVRKWDWALAENHFRNVRPLLSALTQTGLSIMASKGAALLASGLTAQTRLMSDIDILIKPAQIDDVLDIVEALGWNGERGLSRSALKELLLSTRHSISLSNGGRSEVDLHTSAFLLNRCPDHDAMMWVRATEARFGDLYVLAPSAVDMLIVTLAHGQLHNPRPMAYWIGDAISLIEKGAVDWDVFLDEIERRDLTAFAYSGLEYIAQVLERSVPTDVRTTLASQLGEPFLTEFLGHVEFWDAKSRRIRASWGAAASLRAKKWRSRADRTTSRSTVALPDVSIDTGWQPAAQGDGKTFIVHIPDDLHQTSAPIVLQVRILDKSIRCTTPLSVALTCFDVHVSELDHFDFPNEDLGKNNSRHDQIIQFHIDSELVAAYNLRRLQLELLLPDTLDPFPISVDSVEYRWCNWSPSRC